MARSRHSSASRSITSAISRRALQIAAIYERRGDYAARAQPRSSPRGSASRRGRLDLYVASLRAKTGDFDGAVAFLQGLLAASPDDDEVLYNLGVLHGEAKRTDEALRYMEQALAKQPRPRRRAQLHRLHLGGARAAISTRPSR